jgi:hypothetical protein
MKVLLTGIAALFLAIGTAQATENYLVQCGTKLVEVLGHHGYSFFEIKKGDRQRELPSRAFRFDKNDNLYFRGHKCSCSSDQWKEDECLLGKTKQR